MAVSPFAVPVAFTVVDATGGRLGEQQVLVTLLPAEPERWRLAVWRVATPWPGGTARFTAAGVISAYGTTGEHDLCTNPIAVPPGKIASLVNSANGAPALDPAIDGASVAPPTVSSAQSGVKNETASPAFALHVVWLVDALPVASTIDALTSGAVSAFALEAATFWTIGTPQASSANGGDQLFSQTTAACRYVVPTRTDAVVVTVGYDVSSAGYTWAFAPPSV